MRHREAAGRTLLTAIAGGLSPAALADALLGAETERAFADTGHSFDFINKAFECLDLIGWDHAAALLPTLVGQMVAARGAEESTAWRQPVDLVALERGRISPASKRRTFTPRRLAIAIRRNAPRAVE